MSNLPTQQADALCLTMLRHGDEKKMVTFNEILGSHGSSDVPEKLLPRSSGSDLAMNDNPTPTHNKTRMKDILEKAMEDDLCDRTIVAADLLSRLENAKVINKGLQNKINSQTSPHSQASELYQTIITTGIESDYPKLKLALEKTQNKAALELLLSIEKTIPLSTKIGLSNVQPGPNSILVKNQDGVHQDKYLVHPNRSHRNNQAKQPTGSAIVHICSDQTNQPIQEIVDSSMEGPRISSFPRSDTTTTLVKSASTITLEPRIQHNQLPASFKERFEMLFKKHKCGVITVILFIVSMSLATALISGNSGGNSPPGEVGAPAIPTTPVDLTPPHNPRVTEKSSAKPRFQSVPEPGNPKPSTTPTRAYMSPTVSIDLALSQLVYLKNFSHPPQMPLIYIDSIEHTDFFHSMICDNSAKALHLSLESIFESDQFDIPCTNKTSGLEISGNISLQNLYLISQRTTNIQFLAINAQGICDTIDDNLDTLPDINSLEKVSFPNLNFLQIKNLNSECTELLKFVSKVVSAPQLGTLILENVSVQITNVDLIYQFSKSYPLIQYFSFDGKLCPKCEMFSEFNSYVRTGWVLRALNFQIHTNQSQIPGERSVKNLIQSNSLQYFSSNVELTRDNRQESKAVFYKLIHVKFLNISLLLDNTFTQFSARFFTLFPNLIESYTKLNFNSSSVCKLRNDTVRITSLNRYIGPIRIRRISLAAMCNLVAVKGWELPCRDYAFQNNEYSKVGSVVLTDRHASYDCMSFWGD